MLRNIMKMRCVCLAFVSWNSQLQGLKVRVGQIDWKSEKIKLIIEVIDTNT